MNKKIISLFVVVTVFFTSLLSVKAKTRAETLLESMTLDQKILQMLMPDFRQWKQDGETKITDFTVMNKEVAEIIDKYDFGGVILFANNVKETAQTLKLTTDFQKAATDNAAGNGSIPLLLTIDQEGGIVYRLGSGTALPGNMAVGATNSEALSKKVGQVIGRELSALGLNVNFSPVMDVNNNPNNPVIGLRSFSSDPETVAKLGVAMMKGIQEYNVSTAAKHFPGHGDVATDSHTGLPLVNKSYEELKKLELIPFQAAVNNGVDMLMTAHIQYPQIEKDQVVSKKDGSKIYIPATLSDDILTGLVRDKMGYNGIIVTDAMNMAAISEHFGEEEAVVMAIQAGVDIVLMPTILRSKSDLTKIDNIVASVKTAVETGKITEAAINKSVLRILDLKEKRKILDYTADTRTYEEKLAIANKEVGSQENRNIEREVSEAAVTVVKNEDNILPFKPKSGEKVLLLAAYNNEKPGMELSMRRLKNEGIIADDVTYESYRYSNTTDMNEVKAKIDESAYVVVISEVGNKAQMAAGHWLTKVPTDIIDYANSKDKKSVIMSISKPYDVANYPQAKAIVAVYGNKGMDPTEALAPSNAFGPNIPAGVQVIFGGAAARGKLPVDIPAFDGSDFTGNIVYPRGFGLTYPAVNAADKTKLAEAIAAAEKLDRDKYTPESLATLDEALAAAKAANEKDKISQTEVDQAVNALNAAIQALKLKEAKIIAGADQTYVKNSNAKIIIRSDADFSNFKGVTVDGKEIAAGNYLASSGSTVIELKAEFLNTLAVGKHTIGIVSTNGTATTSLTIAPESKPNISGSSQGKTTTSTKKKTINTGDASNLTISLILLLLAASGILYSIKRRKERKV